MTLIQGELSSAISCPWLTFCQFVVYMGTISLKLSSALFNSLELILLLSGDLICQLKDMRVSDFCRCVTEIIKKHSVEFCSAHFSVLQW